MCPRFMATEIKVLTVDKNYVKTLITSLLKTFIVLIRCRFSDQPQIQKIIRLRKINFIRFGSLYLKCEKK